MVTAHDSNPSLSYSKLPRNDLHDTSVGLVLLRLFLDRNIKAILPNP